MMNASARRLPPLTRPLSRLLGRLPHPGSAALATLLNLALRRELPADAYLQMVGRRVEIAVMDWGMRLRFRVMPDRFSPLGQGATMDLSITATARDFALLASGEEDPDTLYFDRRVVVEGDTELALLIKNTLDALAAPKMRKLIRIMHRGMDRLRSFQAQRAFAAGPARH